LGASLGGASLADVGVPDSVRPTARILLLALAFCVNRSQEEAFAYCERVKCCLLPM
jgi:hypothetical protein